MSVPSGLTQVVDTSLRSDTASTRRPVERAATRAAAMLPVGSTAAAVGGVPGEGLGCGLAANATGAPPASASDSATARDSGPAKVRLGICMRVP